MTGAGTLFLTAVAMVAFAGNSIFCRLALRDTRIDAASFTSIRLVSGALALGLLVQMRRGSSGLRAGTWLSALALFAYAIGFSAAYLMLSAGTGALILFGAVQVTMTGYGLARGERLRIAQGAGLALACGGLIGLVIPGLSAPPLAGAALMSAAGIAWGVYSLRGRAARDPTETTAGNFVRSVPFAVAASAVAAPWMAWDARGALLAAASGALTSGLGYAVWYTALGGLSRVSAATVQLAVPVIAAAGGVALLGEPITVRLVLASAAVLGGIALVILARAGPR